MLDKASATPFYQQIANQIRSRIESGEYEPGQLLPTEPMLCKEYDVSRITVRSAIQSLADLGLVIKKPGKGSFVADNISRQSYKSFRGFTAICRENGIPTYSHILKLKQVTPTPDAMRELKLKVDDTVVYLERVRIAASKPVVLERTYLS